MSNSEYINHKKGIFRGKYIIDNGNKIIFTYPVYKQIIVVGIFFFLYAFVYPYFGAPANAKVDYIDFGLMLFPNLNTFGIQRLIVNYLTAFTFTGIVAIFLYLNNTKLTINLINKTYILKNFFITKTGHISKIKYVKYSWGTSRAGKHTYGYWFVTLVIEGEKEFRVLLSGNKEENINLAERLAKRLNIDAKLEEPN